MIETFFIFLNKTENVDTQTPLVTQVLRPTPLLRVTSPPPRGFTIKYFTHGKQKRSPLSSMCDSVL